MILVRSNQQYFLSLVLIFFICLGDLTALWNKKYYRFSPKDKKEIRKRESNITFDQKFYYIETSYYHVFSDVSLEFTAQLSLYMDQYYIGLEKYFGPNLDIEVQVKPTVKVFNDIEDYLKIEKVGKSRGWFKFHYQIIDELEVYDRFHLYTYIRSSQQRKFEYFYVPILNHEGLHQFIQLRAGKNRLPVFFSEGLATYFQYYTFQNKFPERSRRNRSGYRPLLKKRIKKISLKPIQEYCAIQRPWSIDEYGPKTHERYAIAESFISFLLETDDGKKYWPNFFRSALKGIDFCEQLKKPQLESFHQQWVQYVEKKY